MPKALIGIIGEAPLAAKATEVVLEVTAMAFAALLNAYAILRWLSPFIIGINSDYLQASQNTKILSAAIPRMMKITNWFSEENMSTLKIPL